MKKNDENFTSEIEIKLIFKSLHIFYADDEWSENAYNRESLK